MTTTSAWRREHLRQTKLVLVEARGLISRPGGWVQQSGEYHFADGTVGYCSVGAIEKAAPQPYQIADAEDWLGFQIDGGSGVSIIDWNDEPNRTQAEVVAVFDAAIAEIGRELEIW